MEKLLEKISRFKKELSAMYNVSDSSIVWVGNNNFIVIMQDKEIRIGC